MCSVTCLAIWTMTCGRSAVSTDGNLSNVTFHIKSPSHRPQDPQIARPRENTRHLLIKQLLFARAFSVVMLVMNQRQNRKRGFCADEDALQIKLADSTGPALCPDSVVLAAFSGCIRRLPADADVWDLSNLLIEGRPVTRDVVLAWLNAAYFQAQDVEFDSTAQLIQCKLPGLTQLLAFADAVDSSKGLMRALVSQLETFTLQASVPTSNFFFPISCSYIWNRSSSGKYTLTKYTPANPSVHTYGALLDLPSDEKTLFTQLVAVQTEAALHMAYKLQLKPLQDLLHSFLFDNTCRTNSLLYGSLNTVFTERVQQAAAGSGQQHKDLVAGSAITQAFTLVDKWGAQQLLRPLDLSPAQMLPINFTAEVLQDGLSCRAGQRVSVSLDLFDKSVLKLGNDPAGVSLRLLAGPLLTADLMGARP